MTVQLRDVVERQERAIADLERNVDNERYRREVAESVLEDPSLMHNQAVEIERLQERLAEKERELEGIAAGGDAGAAVSSGADAAKLSELEGKAAMMEIELLEARARLEDVVDREIVELRESELKQEIERLNAIAAGAEELRPAPRSSSRRCAPSWPRRRPSASRPRRAQASSRPAWPRCRASWPSVRALPPPRIRRRRASCARRSRSCRSSCAGSSATPPRRPPCASRSRR